MRIPLQGGGHLELNVTEWDPDPVVEASLSTGAFRAGVGTHVCRKMWRAFVDEFALLEEKRQGTATVESISPKELRLVFRSIGSLGHMGVEGYLGYRGGGGPEQLLTFEVLEFDPSCLLPALQAIREMKQSEESAG